MKKLLGIIKSPFVIVGLLIVTFFNCDENFDEQDYE